MDYQKIVIFCIAALTSVNANGQTCNQALYENAPATRFVIHGDGTATDTVTGLMWKRCLEGQVFKPSESYSGQEGTSEPDCLNNSATALSWEQAKQYAQQSDFAGYKDWRLPKIQELISIIEFRCYNPALNLAVFPNALSLGVWSDSPREDGEQDFAWQVDFNHGHDVSVTSSNKSHIRLVREHAAKNF